ncbi:hypothetical protein [Nitrosomonas sp.]|uniref:hypothetical protein n=1 Tax=Nitrosomonas sp. TaxID=42353 RepID=UPI0037C6C9A6
MNILCGMIRVWCFKLWNCRQALRATLLELLLKCKQVFLWNKTEWLYLGRNRAQYEVLWWVLSPEQGG